MTRIKTEIARVREREREGKAMEDTSPPVQVEIDGRRVQQSARTKRRLKREEKKSPLSVLLPRPDGDDDDDVEEEEEERDEKARELEALQFEPSPCTPHEVLRTMQWTAGTTKECIPPTPRAVRNRHKTMTPLRGAAGGIMASSSRHASMTTSAEKKRSVISRASIESCRFLLGGMADVKALPRKFVEEGDEQQQEEKENDDSTAARDRVVEEATWKRRRSGDGMGESPIKNLMTRMCASSEPCDDRAGMMRDTSRGSGSRDTTTGGTDGGNAGDDDDDAEEFIISRRDSLRSWPPQGLGGTHQRTPPRMDVLFASYGDEPEVATRMDGVLGHDDEVQRGDEGYREADNDEDDNMRSLEASPGGRLSRMQSLRETRMLIQQTALRRTESALDPTLFEFLNQYDIVGVIGRSETSEVYKVRSKKYGTFSAVKRNRRATSSYGERSRQLNEMNSVRNLPPHDHVVQYYRCWQEEGFVYTEMELCGKGSLRDTIKTHGPMDEALMWTLLAETASALEHLHRHQIVHLDIKPDNIFIDDSGSYKLGDFGLAFNVSSPGKGDTDAGAVTPVAASVRCGETGNRDIDDDDDDVNVDVDVRPTQPAKRVASSIITVSPTTAIDTNDDWEEGDGRYCAPELLSASTTEPTFAADVFSLGATLFEAATGMHFKKYTPRGTARGDVSVFLKGACSETMRDTICAMMREDPTTRPRAGEIARLAALRCDEAEIARLREFLRPNAAATTTP